MLLTRVKYVLYYISTISAKRGVVMKENFTYPVVLEVSNNHYDIFFPDFENTMTSIDKNDDYIKASQELLALIIKDNVDEGKLLPDASKVADIKINEHQQIVFINIWMPFHQSKIKETYTKKTLTIPTWLNILAKDRNLNFSQILVKALKEELNIK